ncbi:hypothetical protein JTE90_010064 [Oedothorax gibbosus]|uniref:Uncharacterized protein n=1 Tax=Oedothorax gibbosus TaxID=931172 RepID=A0AAV6UZQ9_9ARAC|nr:hypothetical protein JTE90_010064 [Oedothorax gibbosus]
MLDNRYILLIAAVIAVIEIFGTAYAGGSCQSYGHSCLGGHGKRNSETPYALHALLQRAMRTRNIVPFNDYRFPDSNAYDFLKGFSDGIKELEDSAEPQK